MMDKAEEIRPGWARRRRLLLTLLAATAGILASQGLRQADPTLASTILYGSYVVTLILICAQISRRKEAGVATALVVAVSLLTVFWIAIFH